MRSTFKNLRWLLVAMAAAAAVAGMAAVFAFYEWTHPHLPQRSQTEQLKQVNALVQSSGYFEPRATVATVREFFLDYPTGPEPLLASNPTFIRTLT